MCVCCMGFSVACSCAKEDKQLCIHSLGGRGDRQLDNHIVNSYASPRVDIVEELNLQCTPNLRFLTIFWQLGNVHTVCRKVRAVQYCCCISFLRDNSLDFAFIWLYFCQMRKISVRKKGSQVFQIWEAKISQKKRRELR